MKNEIVTIRKLVSDLGSAEVLRLVASAIEAEPERVVEPDPEVVSIGVRWTAASWMGITSADMDGWKQAFPGVDIEQQLRISHEWLLANPKRATKKNWRRFIVNWFAASQNRAAADLAPKKDTWTFEIEEGSDDCNVV